jgi:thiamine biosynthesis protein ThiS
MESKMQIKINSAPVEVAGDCCLLNLLAERRLDGKEVVVVLNDQVIHSDCWKSLKINLGDNLEIIRIIGGG